jgi:hypothetical protein
MRKDQNTTINNGVLCCHFFCFTFSGMASTPNNNTEDALVESSPIGAQAAPDDDDLAKLSPIGAQAYPDDDDVQIVGAPRAIEERNPKKRKSNDGRKRRHLQEATEASCHL